MRAPEYYKVVTMDRSNLLDKLIAILAEHKIRYCVIGGQAVNAYTTPLVSLDLDIVIATDQVESAIALLSMEFNVKRFPHSVNVTAAESELRVQIQTDSRYAAFVERAELRKALDIPMPVAALEDLLQGKVWAAQDRTRRGSKHLKDLTDIARLLETYPELRVKVPLEVLDQID
jgi:hypothetical protein